MILLWAKNVLSLIFNGDVYEFIAKDYISKPNSYKAPNLLVDSINLDKSEGTEDIPDTPKPENFNVKYPTYVFYKRQLKEVNVIPWLIDFSITIASFAWYLAIDGKEKLFALWVPLELIFTFYCACYFFYYQYLQKLDKQKESSQKFFHRIQKAMRNKLKVTEKEIENLDEN